MVRYRLTANKTKFYALAKSFWPDIQPMRHCEYIKFFRVRDYALNFKTGTYPNECYHHLFLSTCCGRILLSDDWTITAEDCTETKGRKVYPLTPATMQLFGMLEAIPDTPDCG